MGALSSSRPGLSTPSFNLWLQPMVPVNNTAGGLEDCGVCWGLSCTNVSRITASVHVLAAAKTPISCAADRSFDLYNGELSRNVICQDFGKYSLFIRSLHFLQSSCLSLSHVRSRRSFNSSALYSLLSIRALDRPHMETDILPRISLPARYSTPLNCL